MITLLFSRRALADVERFTNFTVQHDPEAAAGIFEGIINAVQVLLRHPSIGRPAEHGLRELVISRGRAGYIALYKFDPVRNEILVHRLRHQREVGYREW